MVVSFGGKTSNVIDVGVYIPEDGVIWIVPQEFVATALLGVVVNLTLPQFWKDTKVTKDKPTRE